MSNAISLMLWPLLASFVLVGIHAYLGIHVIARKVIFVDLALAQIAALGAVYGVFLGFSLAQDYWLIKAISVVFTLLGAALFSWTRTRDDRLPHEAIIGIIYAAALSMTLLLTAHLAHGHEEISQLLSGNILWVSQNEVMLTAALYAAVGLIHVIFRRQFFALAQGDIHRRELTSREKLWDFLFYATFGVVVTSSVGMGGVLLVFAYLVIPSVIGVMFAKTLKQRLAVAWISGLLMSFVGVVLSYFFDLPTGPTIVVLLAGLLLVLSLVRQIMDKTKRVSGSYQLVAVMFLVVVLISIPRLYVPHQGHEDEHRELHHAKDDHESLKNIQQELMSTDDKKRAEAIVRLKQIGGSEAKAMLAMQAAREQDPFIVIDIGLALISLADEQGLFWLSKIMMGDFPEFARDDAFMHLQEYLTQTFASKEDLAMWLKAHGKHLSFDQSLGKFILSKDLK